MSKYNVKLHYQEVIIVEGESLTLHRPVKNDPEKFKEFPSDV